jgi:hypothetical protein
VVVGHVREYDVCPRRNTYAGNKLKHGTNESEPPPTTRATLVCQPLFIPVCRKLAPNSRLTQKMLSGLSLQSYTS